MQSALDVGLIESNANTMSEKGYDLVQVVQTNAATCVGTKTAMLMVFKQRSS
jgi:hypothetical protein